jgi:hypothetical protein
MLFNKSTVRDAFRRFTERETETNTTDVLKTVYFTSLEFN